MLVSVINLIKFITTHPLNRDDKVKALIRFAKWQIGSRLVSEAVVHEWINGSRFLVKTGETGLTQNIYTGLHEFADMAFLLHFLRREDLFVDVGANAGSYTILACAAIGARGIAFEPVPGTYKRLVENVHLNHLAEKVKCINKGLGALEGSIPFTSESDTTNHALASGEHCDNVVMVEVTSMDAALHDASPALIKIDVEGYETLVLEGAQETLKKRTLHSVIVELNGSATLYGFDELRILELMFDHGFKSYSYDPKARKLINLDGKNMRSGNTLFVRDESFVVERLRSSPIFSIHGRQF